MSKPTSAKDRSPPRAGRGPLFTGAAGADWTKLLECQRRRLRSSRRSLLFVESGGVFQGGVGGCRFVAAGTAEVFGCVSGIGDPVMSPQPIGSGASDARLLPVNQILQHPITVRGQPGRPRQLANYRGPARKLRPIFRFRRGVPRAFCATSGGS
jgi:hypothetical protein